MKEDRRPLGVTVGEPAGIGPETIARLYEDRASRHVPPFVVFGRADIMRGVVASSNIVTVATPDEAADVFDSAIPVIETLSQCECPVPGHLSEGTQQVTIEAIDAAVSAALGGTVTAVVTAPIHKGHLMASGFSAPGHTEYLARLAGLDDAASVMMLAAEDLRTVPVTVHVPLKSVPAAITHDRIVHAGRVVARDLERRFGLEKPRIAIAGLNPHAGEGGLIGMEEATHIQPAIWTLQDEGIRVTSPQAADTLFHEEARAEYDAVLCMYHDQALIPVKTLDFWGGVNITLGLPFIRTSPDHGTALELAGTGKARTTSMLNAMLMAAEMAVREDDWRRRDLLDDQ